jgi:hypothetical protein
MKNLHLIATDKPSKLFYYDKHLGLARNLVKQNDGVNPQNIYITSDEEIKVGDWYFITESISKCESKYEANDLTDICKKIILTTDPQLIADGVQPIDDTFLEWFIKNPSCEKVETAKGKMKLNDDGQKYGFPDMSLYKIIIPQEEPNLENLESISSTNLSPEFQQLVNDNWDYLIGDEPKPTIKQVDYVAKKQERMYSEEEVFELLKNFNQTAMEHIKGKNQNIMRSPTLKEWFEQFKKK